MSAALESRRGAYAALSSRLAHLDDRQFRSVLASSARVSGLWGSSYAAEVDGAEVFVKRLPLTELEGSRPWSTRNHFRLPTYYNYGVGSAGFGAYRELVAHISTTNWVLEGASPSFPLLLHHRVMARRPSRRSESDVIERYVRRWNNSRAVGEFLTARSEAPQEMWLVLEHIPHQMSAWIVSNQDRVEEVIRQIFDAVSILRGHGMVHFDLHFANVLTDGQTVHIADFGLLNDTGFDLTKSERAFLDRHGNYDYAATLLALGMAPMWRLWTEPAETRASLLTGYPWLVGLERQRDFAAAVIDNVYAMKAGPLAIIAPYAETLRRYRDVILYMAGFFDAMWESPRKNTRYDDDHVRALLKKAGAPIA